MSDRIGSWSSSGDVRIPATFHGTARLLDGAETPATSRPARHDDLPGRFEADLEVDFALLTGVGYVPVDPSHPAWPLYLQASADHATAESPASAGSGIDPHHPDAVVMPFETTITITAQHALQFGLVAPGEARTGSGDDAAVRLVRRGAPPPPMPGVGRPGRDGKPVEGAQSLLARPAPSPDGDFDTFLDFMRDPGRYAGHGLQDAAVPVSTRAPGAITTRIARSELAAEGVPPVS